MNLLTVGAPIEPERQRAGLAQWGCAEGNFDLDCSDESYIWTANGFNFWCPDGKLRRSRTQTYATWSRSSRSVRTRFRRRPAANRRSRPGGRSGRLSRQTGVRVRPGGMAAAGSVADGTGAIASRRSYAGAGASQSQRDGIARGGRLGAQGDARLRDQPGRQDCARVRRY